MKKGIVFGCFDPLHAGHVRMIKKCRSLCDHLTVLVHSNKYIQTQKNREPFFDQSLRVDDVIEIRSVDVVHINEGTDRNQWIRDVGASYIFVSSEMDGKGFCCEVKKILRTEGISSTSIREAC